MKLAEPSNELKTASREFVERVMRQDGEKTDSQKANIADIVARVILMSAVRVPTGVDFRFAESPDG